MSDVSCRDRPLFCLGDGSDERASERCVLENLVGRKDSSGEKVEGQHPPGERRQDPLLEPPCL